MVLEPNWAYEYLTGYCAVSTRAQSNHVDGSDSGLRVGSCRTGRNASLRDVYLFVLSIKGKKEHEQWEEKQAAGEEQRQDLNGNGDTRLNQQWPDSGVVHRPQWKLT